MNAGIVETLNHIAIGISMTDQVNSISTVHEIFGPCVVGTVLGPLLNTLSYAAESIPGFF